MVPVAHRAHLDDVDAEFAVLHGELGQACGIDGGAGEVTELIPIDIRDVLEWLASVAHPADGAGILRRHTVEARRAQEVGIRIADVEAVEGLSAVHALQHRALLQRIAHHPAWGRGMSDLLGLHALRLGSAAVTTHPRTARLCRSGSGHGVRLGEPWAGCASCSGIQRTPEAARTRRLHDVGTVTTSGLAAGATRCVGGRGHDKKAGRRVGVPGVTGLQRRSVAAQHLVVRRIRHRQSRRMRLRQRSL